MLEGMARGEDTRIEPLDTGALPDGLDASNEAHTETSVLAEGILNSNADDHAEDEPANDADVPDDSIEASDEEERAEPAAESVQQNGGDRVDEECSNISDEQYQPDADAHDNLKKIKGVGPAIEKTLNGLGIYRFNQIAEMSEYDIDRVAQHLKGFRSRIYREDWVGQARTLQYEKNTPQ